MEGVGRVAAVRAGDEAAFGAAVERYQRQLHVHCYRMLGSFDEAEDLVQETLLRAWRCLLTRANRQPAAACYLRRPGEAEYRPFSLDVLWVEHGEVAAPGGSASHLRHHIATPEEWDP